MSPTFRGRLRREDLTRTRREDHREGKSQASLTRSERLRPMSAWRTVLCRLTTLVRSGRPSPVSRRFLGLQADIRSAALCTIQRGESQRLRLGSVGNGGFRFRVRSGGIEGAATAASRRPGRRQPVLMNRWTALVQLAVGGAIMSCPWLKPDGRGNGLHGDDRLVPERVEIVLDRLFE